MTCVYVNVLVCFHYMFFCVFSSQGEEEEGREMQRQQKRWWRQVAKKSTGWGRWRL